MASALESGFILALLVSCLIALLLVSVARREARAVREQANEDAREQRTHLKERTHELDVRLEAVHAAERELAAERRGVRKQRQQLQVREAALLTKEQELAAERAEAAADVERRLHQLASVTPERARAELNERLLAEASRRAAAEVAEIEARARHDGERRAQGILASAMQRGVAAATSTTTTSTVVLPVDEMRGRIIGKEGRNINAFEALTGVNLLLDDASRTVVLSCFDPERREIATLALESLVDDGRINPQRIEEAVEQARAGADLRAVEAGRRAALDADVTGLPDAVVGVLGRLRLRSSHGQNVLAHSVEVARIAGILAVETGADPERARRGGLLHDLGKGLGGEGTHAQAGAELLARHDEDPAVVNAVAAHHDEVPAQSVEAVLVQVADACSAARPGARPTEAAHFAQRMEQIESVVRDVPGVAEAIVMASGREVRVIVDPDVVDDRSLDSLGRDVAARITDRVEVPGSLRVTVVRERRSVATVGDEPVPGDGGAPWNGPASAEVAPAPDAAL